MANNVNKPTASFIETHRTLLTREEEVELFTSWYDAPESKKEVILTKIIRSYSPIIKAAVRDLSGYRVDPEELISEGLVALVQAANRYDISTGFRFSTFAKRWVSGVMLGYITKNFFPVNICTSHKKKKLFFAIRRLIASKLKASGSFDLNHAMAVEMAEEYKVKPEDVVSIYEMIRRPPVGLSSPTHDEDPDGLTIEHYISANSPTAEEILTGECSNRFHQKIVSEAIHMVLTERERNIFLKQVLAPKEESMTLDELGSVWNVSRERIRQIRNDAGDLVSREVKRRLDELGMEPADIF